MAVGGWGPALLWCSGFSLWWLLFSFFCLRFDIIYWQKRKKKTAGKETGLLMKYKIIRIKVLKELNLSLLAKHHVFNSASYAKEVKKAGKYPVHSYLPFNNYNIHNSFYKHYGCCKIVNLVSLCSKCELFISLSF